MSTKTFGVKDERKGSFLRKTLTVLIPVGILLAFVLLLVILVSLQKEPEVKKRSIPELSVMATPANIESVELKVTVQGETRPRTEIDLVPEVGGKITYVSPKFLSGGLFKKGDILYRIEESDYQVGVMRAGAAVARAQQVVIRERAESEIARRDWEDLGEGEPTDLTLRKPQLLEAEASLQSAQADLDNAKLKLERTAVKAPFDGRVREKFADIGQYVNPGSRLGRIFATDVTEVRLALSDADLARLDLPIAYVAKSGAEAADVRITNTIGGKVRAWHGKIMRTDSTYDTQTRSLFAIAEVADPYGKGAADGGYPLAPGLFVDARITGKTLEDVITFPRDGLRPEDKVFVVNDKGFAESRDVIVLDVNPDRAVIATGVAPGELVILSPLEYSQISLKFRAYDFYAPETVLVEPVKESKEDADDDAGFAKKGSGSGKGTTSEGASE